MSIPQLILTLSPQGQLIAELPGANGARRQVKLHGDDETVVASLHRMLAAQLRGRVAIGLDGAPTQAQERHWARHGGLWGDPTCAFCISEGRFAAPLKRKAKPRKIPIGDESVVVRKGTGIGTNKVLVPDPNGGVLPVLVTKREARKLGWKGQEQRASVNPEGIGL